MGLEDRDVLVGGGMEHDLGTVFLEQRVEPLPLADVRENRDHGHDLGQLGQELVQVRLVVVDDDDRGCESNPMA